MFGNRGASGIDGNVSTALGVAASEPRNPLVAILGDITFYHDLNGLLAVGAHKLENVTIVLLDNNGGGIFRRLPIARFEPPFTQAFLTPHGLDFSHVAQMYGLEYIQAASYPELTAILAEIFAPETKPLPRLIEVQTDSMIDLQQRKAVMEHIHKSILEGEI